MKNNQTTTEGWEKELRLYLTSAGDRRRTIHFIKQLLAKEKKAVAEDICVIIDKIEEQSETNTLEEWRQYKHIRNAIRDKYVIAHSQEDRGGNGGSKPNGAGGGSLGAKEIDLNFPEEDREGKVKTIIKVWKGRAYLHQEWKEFGFNVEKATPLGNNTAFIQKMMNHYKCDIIFLNDDFTVEAQSDIPR